MPPAPSRAVTAGAYAEIAIAAPDTFHVGCAHVAAEKTHVLPDAHAPQRAASPIEKGVGSTVDHCVKSASGQLLEPASDDDPKGHGFCVDEFVPAGQKKPAGHKYDVPTVCAKRQ